MRAVSKILAVMLGALAIIPTAAQGGPATIGPAANSVSEEMSASPPRRTDRDASPITAADVTPWLDGFMPLAISRGGIPGAVVVVVKDGQVIAQRGYGYANLGKRVRVDPQKTLFRPGSVSKLFAWTALMQQVDSGKVGLDEDVNRYIDFTIPSYAGQPVKIRDILTHTPGFEEQLKDIISTNPNAYIAFETMLKRWVPKRIFAPGTTPAYSNYGASLAGYIVQRVSGEPFEEYVERHIFRPLAMTRSTFRQPLPVSLSGSMAEGYEFGKERPYGFEYVSAPAGGLSSTAADMAKFMVAHLEGGGPLLSPATARLMHSRARQRIPGLNGMAYGFYEENINGRRVIGHGGDTIAFHSDLHLFIDDGVGLFVSFNSAGKDGAVGHLRKALLENFADRYFPSAPDTRTISAAAAQANAQKVVGLWSAARASHSSFMSIGNLFSQISVTTDDQGRLIIPQFRDDLGQPRKWIAAGPMLWRDGHELAGARLVNGKAALLGVGRSSPIISFVPVPLSRSSAWILPMLYLAICILILTSAIWPARAIVRRSFGVALPITGRQLWAYRASRMAATATIAVLVGWVVLVSMMLSDVNTLSSGSDFIVLLLQALSSLTFIGGILVMGWYVYTSWKDKASWRQKLWSVLLLISSITILYIAVVFHLIGFTSNY